MIFTYPDRHLTDQEFFTYIKFFDFIIGKKELDEEGAKSFGLADIMLGDEDLYNVFNRIYMSVQILDLNIKIKKLTYYNSEIEAALKSAEAKPAKKRDKLLKIIKKVQDDKAIKITDVASVSWVWYEIYKAMRFYPHKYIPSPDIETIFKTEIDRYLDAFINNKLTIHKKNFFNFETQKRNLLKLIEKENKINLYGNNFIISQAIDKKGNLRVNADFCIIQTVYAMQKLGYLKVFALWEEPKDNFFEAANRNININLVLEESFIREINNSYKQDNPQIIFEKFDSSRGILKFAGQEIELSKKNKETDAVLLLKTLQKADSDNWMFNDEILMDWGYNEDDQKDIPKNKVYFAGQKINNAIAIKTKIEDFIECNTSKARINPKYRKIDE